MHILFSNNFKGIAKSLRFSLKKSVATVNLTHVWFWPLFSSAIAILGGVITDSIILASLFLASDRIASPLLTLFIYIMLLRILWQFRLYNSTDGRLLLFMLIDNPLLKIEYEIERNSLSDSEKFLWRICQVISTIITIVIYMKKETIIVKNLKKAYGTKTVTDDVSVTFYSGEIVSLVGHNGAGKTTFLNQLNGTVSSDSGTVYIHGVDITNHPNRARELVSSMPQFQVPIKGVTIKEAIECIGLLKGMKKSELNKSSKQLMDYLAIEKWQSTTGEKLSGGLQRLTSFAMTVVDTPSIIVLDEPTNDVDPFRRTLMWRYLRILANNGATVIIVTHNLFEVERYSDRYLMIDRGKIQKDVNVSDIKKERHILHQVSILVADESLLDNYSHQTSVRYDKFEKRMSFSVEDNQLQRTLSLILEWLREDKIISYDIKLKSLSDDYEEYIDE